MSLQFITGASGSGKSTYIDQQIIARSEREPEGRFFILVPDQFTMQTQKDLVSLHDRKGIMNIDVLSFGRLTHRIFEEMGANRLPMLDDTGKSLIIRRVAAGQRMELPVLGGRLGQTGYIHEVKSAISEFMQYGIGLQELDQLTEFSKKRGQLYYKLKDLRTIYEGFQQFIREKYLTTEESLEVLASYVPQSKLLKDSVIVFDGFTGFTPVQNRVIAELMKQAGMNTLLGMGTVFVVLILISLIISCFSFIPKLQEKFSKKAAPAPAAAPVPAAPAVEEEELADDTELVAVIAAAIAAYEGTSTDGFQVRSIKRASTRKWKNA